MNGCYVLFPALSNTNYVYDNLKYHGYFWLICFSVYRDITGGISTHPHPPSWNSALIASLWLLLKVLYSKWVSVLILHFDKVSRDQLWRFEEICSSPNGLSHQRVLQGTGERLNLNSYMCLSRQSCKALNSDIIWETRASDVRVMNSAYHTDHRNNTSLNLHVYDPHYSRCCPGNWVRWH